MTLVDDLARRARFGRGLLGDGGDAGALGSVGSCRGGFGADYGI
jgi:hypothetical protein